MKELKETAALNTVPELDESEQLQEVERPDIGNYKTMQVGEGDNVMKSDKNGFWLGASSFANAPFRVDMQGRLYLSSSDGTNQMILDAINQRILFVEDDINRAIFGKRG